MDGLWRIQLLGGLRAERGGRAVSRFRTRQTGALLARLALFPRRAHAREELADLLWPEADAGAGRNRLRVAVSSLRRVLEPPGAEPGSVLWADRGSVRLNPSAFVCDAAEFEAALARAGRAASPAAAREALEAAASLFAGELLPGFYDDWVAEERERLNALYEESIGRTSGATTPRAENPASQSQHLSEEQAGGTPRLLSVPLQFTRFFGREREVAQLVGLVRDPQVRLVTLSGAGGSGKTRLSIETVRNLAETQDGPFVFVPLADMTSADLIPAAIVEALGLARAADRDAVEQIAEALSGYPGAVLVLDNLEHLVERGAPCVLSLLTRLSALTCLVTSRRRLGLPGEREFLVAPLPLPPAEGELERVFASSSVQLFVDRAQAVRPDFQLTRNNVRSVAALCRTLEGIPLALELVAARVHALTPAQMITRLSSRLDVGADRYRGGPDRHRSLWAAVGWSYDLLPPPLRRFFAQLSVFRGGCTPEAAQTVCGEAQALECLTQLRERSLAQVEEAGGGLRFRLLETLREFAAEQLSKGEGEALGHRHAEYFLRLAEEAAPQLTGPEQAQWLARLEADHGNVRAALSWWLADDRTAGEALRLSASLWRFWAVHGHYSEGRAWLGRAMAQPGGMDAARAKAAVGAGNLARAQGDYDAAEALFVSALATMRAEGQDFAVGSCLVNLGMVAMHREDYARSVALYEESLDIRREIGDRDGMAFCVQCLGIVAYHQQDYPRACAYFRESLALWETLDNDGGRMWALGNLATVAAASGEDEEAARLFPQALRLGLALDDQETLAYTVAGLGELALRGGRLPRAATLLGAADALIAKAGMRPPPATAAKFASVITEARAALPEREWESLWAEGREMTGPQAAAYALEENA